MRALQRAFQPAGRHGKVVCIYLSHDKPYSMEEILGSIIKQVVQGDDILPRAVTDLYMACFHREAITANNNDLRLFIDHTLNGHYAVRRLLEEDPHLRDEITNLITWKCRNIFLLAKLQIRVLLPALKERSLSSADLRKELIIRLPEAPDLEAMYSTLLERIMEQRTESRDTRRAYHILAWVALSRRDLGLTELHGAMLCDPEMRDIGDPSLIDTQDTIRDICDGLVTFSRGRIHLVHYTTKEYFDRNAKTLFGDFQVHIATTCATYLSSKSLEEPILSDYWKRYSESLVEEDSPQSLDLEYEHLDQVYHYARTLLQNFPLLPYSLQHLGYHLQQNPGTPVPNTVKHVISLLGNSSKMAFMYRWLKLMNLIQPNDKRRRHALAGFGLYEIYLDPLDDLGLAEPVNIGNEATNPSGMWARMEETAELLMNEELDIYINGLIYRLGMGDVGLGEKDEEPALNGKDTNNNGEASSDPTCSAKESYSPSKEDDPSTVGDSKVEISINLELGEVRRLTTPTHIAAWYGYLPVLEDFLKRQRDVNSVDEFNRPPVVVALQQGNMDAVGVSAAGRGDAQAIARMLANEMAGAMNRRSQVGMMSLFVAVEFGSIETVMALIDGGVDINTRDFEGNTPLIRASSRCNRKMVLALLDKKADVNTRNDQGLTVWSVNLKPGNEEVLDVLAARGAADPDATDCNREPVLYCHAAGGNLLMVQFLLGRGINPSNQTRFRWAPLHWAANNGHLECVRALLAYGADHSPLSDTTQTPLDMAAQQGHHQIVETLQEAGARRGSDYYDPEALSETLSDGYRSYFDSDFGETQSLISSDGSAQYYNEDGFGDDNEIIGIQDGFEAAINRLDDRTNITPATKRRLFEFFFRDFSSVIHDLEELDDDSDSDSDELVVSEAVSQRWTEVVNEWKQRDSIFRLLNSQPDV
ncbi:ankyrin repeat protein [Colletotrichum kahawae]|uniref:Ankyrin repeat protein n=1 Tax=Colletotrichum kahawae TaxID=34407 RepID=A0AAD9YCI8_COLKA|nr:ankyrin repeat protein [Colletotrichum kahawae]